MRKHNKLSKSLLLNSQTVRALDAALVAQAAGGATVGACRPSQVWGTCAPAATCTQYA